MKKRIFTISLLALILIAFPLLSATAGEPTAKNPVVWKLNSNFQPSGAIAKGELFFIEEVKKRSGGRFIIEPYFNASLGYKSSEALSILRKGLVEITEVSSGGSIGEEPLTSIVSLPFLFDNKDAYMNWHLNSFFPAMNQVLSKKWKSKMFAPIPFPPIYFFSKEPVRIFQDLQGLKVRTWGGILMDGLKMMGCEPFRIDTAELYTALQRGLVTASITSYVSATEAHFWEVLKYIDKIPLTYNAFSLAMNLDAYNALPEDLQQVLMDCARDYTNYVIVANNKVELDLGQKLVDNGMEMVEPEPGLNKQLSTKIKPLYEKFAKEAGPEATKLLQDLGKI
jgi:TRAP-type C4-dicarboxylate transport system substrate-binding protein